MVMRKERERKTKKNHHGKVFTYANLKSFFANGVQLMLTLVAE